MRNLNGKLWAAVKLSKSSNFGGVFGHGFLAGSDTKTVSRYYDWLPPDECCFPMNSSRWMPASEHVQCFSIRLNKSGIGILTLPIHFHLLHASQQQQLCVTHTHARARAHKHTSTNYNFPFLDSCLWLVKIKQDWLWHVCVRLMPARLYTWLCESLSLVFIFHDIRFILCLIIIDTNRSAFIHAGDTISIWNGSEINRQKVSIYCLYGRKMEIIPV